MSRRFGLVGLSMVCVLLLAVSMVTAAEDFLKLVPDGALGFVVLNRPGAVNGKLQALGSQMRLPAPDLLAMFKQRSGIKEGWDESGTIVLLVLPQGIGAPMEILLVPVTDYGKFVKQLGAEDAKGPVTKIEIAHIALLARSIGGYAAITDELHRETLEKTLTLSKEVPAALAPWRKWLAERDVAAVILPPGIEAVWVIAQQWTQLMKAVVAAQANEQAKAAAGMFDLYAKLFQAAEREVAACGFGVQLDKENVLRLTSRSLLVPGGKWARLIAQGRPSSENLPAGLPAEPFVAAGGAAVSGAVWETARKWSFDMMKSAPQIYGITEEQAKKLSEFSIESMKEVRAFSMMLAAGKQGSPIFSNAVIVMRVERASVFTAAYEKQMQEYAGLVKGVHSPMLPAMEITKTEVGGTAALQVTATIPTPPVGGPMVQAQQARTMELFFGPGGKITAWIVPADDHHIVMGYSKEPVQRTMEAIRQGKPGLAGDDAVAKTTALLPSAPVAVVYVSPTGVIVFFTRFVPGVTPPELKLDLNFPEFPKTPPIGFAVTTAADEVRTCLVVPPEVLRAIVPYVGKVQAMKGGPAGH